MITRISSRRWISVNEWRGFEERSRISRDERFVKIRSWRIERELDDRLRDRRRGSESNWDDSISRIALLKQYEGLLDDCAFCTCWNQVNLHQEHRIWEERKDQWKIDWWREYHLIDPEIYWIIRIEEGGWCLTLNEFGCQLENGFRDRSRCSNRGRERKASSSREFIRLPFNSVISNGHCYG